MGTLKQAVDRVAAAKTAIGNAITAKGGTVNQGDGLEEFAADIATITNQYIADDEGKVVSGGALVAQTAYPTTITKNDTYNTVENNSVTVNVPSLPSDFISITKKYGEGTINYLYWIETDECYYLIGKIYFISTASSIYIYSLPSNIMSKYKSGMYIEDGTYIYPGAATSPEYNTETSIRIPVSSYTQYKKYYFMFVFGK